MAEDNIVPIKYDSGFLLQAETYYSECLEKTHPPTLKEFASLLGVDESTILAWANKKRKDDSGNVTQELARPKFLAAITRIQEYQVPTPLAQTSQPSTKKNSKKSKKDESDKTEPNPEGRPPKFKTVEEMQAKIDEYFTSCWTQKIDMFGNPIFLKDAAGKTTDKKVMVQFRPYTVTGLAVALDTTRDLLIDYAQKDEFSDAIKRAKEICHNYAEESLFIGKNPAGAIFNLKNNYNWKDKTETEHSGNVTWVEEDPK